MTRFARSLAVVFLVALAAGLVPASLQAEDVGPNEPEETVVLVLEIEEAQAETRTYELVTSTRGGDGELSLGHRVPLTVLQDGQRQTQYQEVGFRLRAQVSRLPEGRYRVRARIEDRHLTGTTTEGQPEMADVSQAVQAVLQPGVPVEVASADGRVHRLTLRFPNGRGVGVGR